MRHYKRACPGVNGQPCPKNAHLRKDSKGGVCGTCRPKLVWNGLVDAEPARRHLRWLSRRGVGRRSVAAASDVGDTTLSEIISGTKKQIRKETADRILAVTRAALGDWTIVPAEKTWKAIRWLLSEGFTKTSLARRLGYESPALQIKKDFVLAKTEAKVLRLYRLLRLE